MKTRSEMLEDAQRSRTTTLLNKWEAQDARGDLKDVSTDQPCRPIVIPEGTLIQVADRSMKLTPHILKKAHMFMSYLVGCEPELEMRSKGRENPVMTNPAMMLKVGYYTFDTLNSDWPYIVVPSDRLTTEEKK